MIKRLVLLLFLQICSCKKVEITFKNVTFHGYSVYVHKFQKTIDFSNSLSENLPKNQVYDKIEFINQNIPVLYKNSVSDIEDLDELVIEKCELLEITPGTFKNVPLLRKLSLKGNKLKEIQDGVFNNLQIYDLDLSRNEIKIISSGALDNLPKLLNIHLSDNLISSWNPKWFKNSPLVTRVSMQNNSLESLPSNAFKNLAGSKKLSGLELKLNLIFSYNKIKNINPDTFKGLETLNNLWLDNNLLEDFEENLLDNIQVDELRLNSNNIKCFEGDLNKILKARINYVDNNPFDCDCLKKIQDFSTKNEKSIDLFFSTSNCRIQRITTKIEDLTKRLKELRNDLEEKESSNEEVEWVVLRNNNKPLKYTL